MKTTNPSAARYMRRAVVVLLVSCAVPVVAALLGSVLEPRNPYAAIAYGLMASSVPMVTLVVIGIMTIMLWRDLDSGWRRFAMIPFTFFGVVALLVVMYLAT